jgi:hypothetical protein
LIYQNGYCRELTSRGGSGLTGNLERRKVAEILAVYASTTKDVNYIVDQCGRMTFSRRRDEPDALKFCPFPRIEVESPCVVIVILAIRPSKAKYSSEAVRKDPDTTYIISRSP